MVSVISLLSFFSYFFLFFLFSQIGYWSRAASGGGLIEKNLDINEDRDLLSRFVTSSRLNRLFLLQIKTNNSGQAE